MNLGTFAAPKTVTRLLLCAASLPMAMASTAFAQTTSAPMETVVVTGSLIARPDYNTATPTVAVTTDALKNSGQIALEAGLRDMPQFSTATAGSGPFIGGSGQVNLSLRGLGPQRNLVLLDGRRLLPSNSDGTVDINQLPAGIVQNVEVITGGASAVYGSDAVSGVVNFKTKRAADGLDLTSSYGTTQKFGGSQFDVNLVGGMNTADGRGNITIAVEYTRRSKVNWFSIPFLRQATSGVTPLVTGQYVPGSTNAPTQAAVDAYFAPFGAPAGNVKNTATAGFGFNSDGSIFNVGPNTTAPFNVYNLKPLLDAQGRSLLDVNGGSVRNRSYYYRGTQAPLERWSSFVKGDWALSNSVHFFGQALYTNYSSLVESDATVTSATQVPTIPFTNPFLQSLLTANPGVAAILASRPSPTGTLNLNKRFLGIGGYRDAVNANNVYQFLGGINGTARDTLTWELYASHGQTLTNYSSSGAVRFSTIQTLLNAADGGASLCAGGFNPFGNNTSSDACKLYASPDFSNRTTVTQDVINADVQGTAFKLPYGDVQFAVGYDYRRIAFRFQPDAAVITGDPFTFNPQAPAKGASGVNEFFGEMLVPIVKDMPLMKSVQLDMAARYSNYDLSGGTNSYKADLDWALIDSLRIRGGYERAVRAPSVNELFAGDSTSYQNRTVQTSIPAGAGDPCDNRLRPAGNAGYNALCLSQGFGGSQAVLNAYSTNDNQVPAIASGNLTLKPEKADTWTLGTVYQPDFNTPWFQNANISVDYYNIRVRQAIAQIDFNTKINKCFNLDGSNPGYDPANFYCSNIQRSSSNNQMFNVRTPYANTGGYKTNGVDVAANWVTDIAEITGWGSDAGTLSVDMFANYLGGFKTQILPGQAYISYGQTDISTSGSITLGPYPKYTSNSNFTWHNTNLGIDLGLRWRFIGGLKDSAYVTNKLTTNPRQGAADYFDLHGSYLYPETGTRFSLVVNNLFDRNPSQVGVNVGSTNAALYSVLGRQFLFTVDQKF